MQESGITLELFGVSHSKTSPFDEEHFWTTVVSTPGQEEAHEISSGTPTSEGLEEILGRIRRKEIKRRALSRLKLTLGPGVELPVRLFSPLVEARKRQHTWVDTKSGRPMRPLTRWTNVETGAIVSDQSVRPYFDFGGAKAIFTEDELASMKYFGPPGLTLIGFKPLETLDLSLNLIPALFVYPDELGAPGSVCAFSALLTVMLEERMIAYCRYIPKSSVTPRLVALVPQAEAFDSNEAWRKLSGLHLITLPYSEEIRAVSLPKVEMEPKDGAIDALVAVIDRLTLRDGFNPLCYENPALRKHCAGLQALALVSQDTADAITDSTVPKVEEMLEKADEALSRVHQLLPQPARHASQRGSERVGSKRKTPSASFP